MLYKSTERQGVLRVGLIFSEDFDWIFRDQPIEDWGIDAEIEVVSEGIPTGRLIAAQIKSGESWFKEQDDKGFIYRGDERHLEYWRGHSLPVVLILYNPQTQTAYWEIIRDELITQTGKGWKITVPKQQHLNKTSANDLRKFALPDYPKLRKFDYLSSLLNGFASSSDKGYSRLPIVYASLFAADERICLLAPFIDSELINALAVASTLAKVDLVIREVVDPAISLNQLKADFPNLTIRVLDSLHAKMIIIDSALAIVGSANFTRPSLQRSMEVQIAFSDLDLVSNMHDEFDKVWNASKI
ncbi:MAG TPA: DUF4365 domain-containing protein [Pyrinomonadaceae bacterium]|jgi:hypothetical protein|nr:DUF4365 domain-containing protein [Pyrinomonadaceae bacterium]